MGIYIIRAANGPIKIGYTSNHPSSRLSEIRVSSFAELELVAFLEGDKAKEKSLHKRFSKLRIRGEWFAPDEALLEFIRSLPPPPDGGRKAQWRYRSDDEKEAARRIWFDPTIKTNVEAGKLAGISVQLARKMFGPSGRETSWMTPDAAAEMQRKSAEARVKARLPEDQARQHWMNTRLTIPQALAKMPGWVRQSAYNTFGKRGLAPGRPKKGDDGKIYFIRANGKGAVKIGYAVSVLKRVRALQISHRHRLAVVGVMKGTQKDEKDLHKRFAHLRLGGEWFDCKADLLEFLATVPKWDGKS